MPTKPLQKALKDMLHDCHPDFESFLTWSKENHQNKEAANNTQKQLCTDIVGLARAHRKSVGVKACSIPMTIGDFHKAFEYLISHTMTKNNYMTKQLIPTKLKSVGNCKKI